MRIVYAVSCGKLFCDFDWLIGVYTNNSNNHNNQDHVYSAVVMASHCRGSPSSSDKCRLSARWPPTLKPSQSYWSVVYHPTKGGRLSRPKPCSEVVQPVYHRVAVVMNTTARGVVQTWVLWYCSPAGPVILQSGRLPVDHGDDGWQLFIVVVAVRCHRCSVFVSSLIDCSATRLFVSHRHWSALCCLCCELLLYSHSYMSVLRLYSRVHIASLRSCEQCVVDQCMDY